MIKILPAKLDWDFSDWGWNWVDNECVKNFIVESVSNQVGVIKIEIKESNFFHENKIYDSK